jgi:hypothetical protein
MPVRGCWLWQPHTTHVLLRYTAAESAARHQEAEALSGPLPTTYTTSLPSRPSAGHPYLLIKHCCFPGPPWATSHLLIQHCCLSGIPWATPTYWYNIAASQALCGPPDLLVQHFCFPGPLLATPTYWYNIAASQAHLLIQHRCLPGTSLATSHLLIQHCCLPGPPLALIIDRTLFNNLAPILCNDRIRKRLSSNISGCRL